MSKKTHVLTKSNNYHRDQESINSNEEAEQQNTDLGVGRSYECVFCKRAFNAAQALGGHMNNHGKYSATSNPNINTPNKQLEQVNYYHTGGPRLSQQMIIPPDSSSSSSSYNCYSMNDQSANNHRFIETYVPDCGHRQPLISTPGDSRMSLSLELQLSINRQEMDREEEEELDLELRLGYDS